MVSMVAKVSVKQRIFQSQKAGEKELSTAVIIRLFAENKGRTRILQ